MLFARGCALALALLSCDSENRGGIIAPPPAPPPPPPPPAPPPVVITPGNLTVLGQGAVPDRFTAELWVEGNTAYTTTWGIRSVGGMQNRGNSLKIWDVSAATPVLVDSVIVAEASTLGDVQVTDDGKYLIVATEPTPGAIVIYDLGDPRKPVLLTRFTNSDTNGGVHTAEVQPVNGRLYAFLCIDRRGTAPARLVIVDITNPSAPAMVFSKPSGNPFVHDVFVRDGILMTALWNDGIAIFDIGGGGKGGTVANPVQLGATSIVGGKAHNIFWYRDPSNGSKRFAFVGEEGPGSIGFSSVGDVHVIDVTDFSKPREVGFFNAPGHGVHNFSADEAGGILYAAYYSGGVRALNIRGDLGACTSAEKSSDGRCDLTKMNREVARGPSGITSAVYVWGVHYTNGRLYASDMLNGLWRLSTAPSP